MYSQYIVNQYIVSQYIVSQYTVIKWCILLIVFYNSCFVFIFYYLRFIFILTGVVMISGALCADAIIGNVQEKTMKQFSASNAEVVSDSMYGVVYTTCCQFSTLVPCAAIIDQQVGTFKVELTVASDRTIPLYSISRF